MGVVADGSQQAWAIEGNQAWSDRRSLDLPLVDGELDGILPVVSSAASQGSVIVDVRTGKELTRVFAGKDVRVCGADERTVFVTLCDGRRIWLYETGSTEAALKDFDDVSSDGALGVSNAERTVEIWDVVNSRRRRTIATDWIASRVALSADGKRLAAVVTAEAPFTAGWR